MSERSRPQSTETSANRLPLRERVSAEVLGYLEYLRSKMLVIAQKHGAADLRELPRKIENGEMSIEGVDRLVELKEAFEGAAREGKVPIEELERWEGEIERSKREFLGSLRKVAEVVLNGNAQIFKNDDELEVKIKTILDALPGLSSEAVLRSESLMAEILKTLRAHEVLGNETRLGLVASIVMNQIVRDLPDAVRGRVVQIVDGDGLDNLGYKWFDGKLVVRGRIGRGLGSGMRGGWIEAKSEGLLNDVGSYMTGGEIHLKNAGNDLGFCMDGGSIFARNAYGKVGQRMRAGLVEISGEIKGIVGNSMFGGVIRADTVTGEYGIGEDMDGTGQIYVRRADRAIVGCRMKSGQIEIDGPCLWVGFHMSGGSVRVNGCCDKVGQFMSGGEVDVNNAESVGANMTNGTVTVRGDAGTIGLFITGGTVTVHGRARAVGPHTGGTVTVLGNPTP